MTKRYPTITSRHTYSNPTEKSCFRMCRSCMRCSNKGSMVSCDGCSGRPDPFGQRIPYSDDYCDCTRGVMRWQTKEGQLVVRRYESSPFGTQVFIDAKSGDEEDWERYLDEKREELDDPFFNPIKVEEEGV